MFVNLDKIVDDIIYFLDTEQENNVTTWGDIVNNFVPSYVNSDNIDRYDISEYDTIYDFCIELYNVTIEFVEDGHYFDFYTKLKRHILNSAKASII